MSLGHYSTMTLTRPYMSNRVLFPPPPRITRQTLRCSSSLPSRYPIWTIFGVVLTLLPRFFEGMPPWAVIAVITAQASSGVVDAVLFGLTNRHATEAILRSLARCCQCERRRKTPPSIAHWFSRATPRRRRTAPTAVDGLLQRSPRRLKTASAAT